MPPSLLLQPAPRKHNRRRDPALASLQDGIEAMSETSSVVVQGRSVEPTVFDIPGATGEFKIQILNEDQAKGVVTTVVHLPAGGVIPAHKHQKGAEMHYVLEGDLIDGGKTLGAGDFLTHAAGTVHGPHESKGGAKVLTVQTWQSSDGTFDFEPA